MMKREHVVQCEAGHGSAQAALVSRIALTEYSADLSAPFRPAEPTVRISEF